MTTALSRALLAAAALSLLAAPSTATLITFDTLPATTLVTTQYPGLTFSSSPGEGLYTSPGSPISSPNFLCTAPIGSEFDCINDVYIDFATPVSNVSIWAIEPNQFGTVATCFLYNGATLLGTHNITGLATLPATFTPGNLFVDLSAFTNITRLEIRGPGGSGPLDNSYGGNGIGWDDLSYTAVPTPATLALLAITTLSAARRRRA